MPPTADIVAVLAVAASLLTALASFVTAMRLAPKIERVHELVNGLSHERDQLHERAAGAEGVEVGRTRAHDEAVARSGGSQEAG